jgi:hypothetical protein
VRPSAGESHPRIASPPPGPSSAAGREPADLYLKDPHSGILYATGLLVITLTGTGISAMTIFDTSVLAGLGFPGTLPA